MNKKKFVLKIGVLFSVISLLGVSFTLATSFHFNVDKVEGVADAIKRNMLPIHFVDNGNDFGGFFYFANGFLDDTDVDENYLVQIDGSTEKPYECGKLMKGFYYNAERGEILWPLDGDTWSDMPILNDLTTNGGMYTKCRKGGYHEALEECKTLGTDCPEGTDCGDVKTCQDEVDQNYPGDNAYYGFIEHEYGGRNFVLIAGVNYDNTATPWVVPLQTSKTLAQTFVRFDNQIPVGFVYDYNGGAGFVGCRFTVSNGENLRKVIVAVQSDPRGLQSENLFKRTDDYLEYKGGTYLTCTGNGVDADSLTRLLVEGLVGLSRTSDLSVQGNQTSKKMQYFVSANINNATLINNAKRRSEILCRGKWNKGGGDDVVCIENRSLDASETKNYKNKTLIVKNGDVTIKPEENAGTTDYYDIFINHGNLLIDETGAKKFVFNTQGFLVSGKTEEDFQNDITSALAVGSYSGPLSAVGSFVRGSFIVDGNVKNKDSSGEPLNYKYFIYGKFTSRDTFDSLENVFGWRCNNGYSTDHNTYCPPSLKGWKNPYENAALVVIDQDYGSPLLK